MKQNVDIEELVQEYNMPEYLAYFVINTLNQELRAQGFNISEASLETNRRYFLYRLGLE